MALTSKQIAGNQKRTMRSLITKLDEMAAAYGDVDNAMMDECQLLIDAAEVYFQALQDHIDSEEDNQEDY